MMKMKNMKEGDALVLGNKEFEATSETCDEYTAVIRIAKHTRASLEGKKASLLKEIADIDVMLAEMDKAQVEPVE